MSNRETGFPSPAQGYEARGFDFNRILIRNPAATYVMKVSSSDTVRLGLLPGDLLIVDRSLAIKAGCLAVFSYEGTFLCRQFVREGAEYRFSDGNGGIITADEDTEIFGAVTHIIKEC